ncbi:hypothetical protein KF840_00355 [bacterium]|nr:hypothetical protein [bacterium]
MACAADGAAACEVIAVAPGSLEMIARGGGGVLDSCARRVLAWQEAQHFRPAEDMPRYRATIYVNGVDGDTPSAARAAVEEQLKQSGLENCRVVSVDPEGLTGRPVRRPASAAQPDPDWRRQSNAGGLLLVAAVAWAIWFFWWMLSSGHD